ncbi:hypothetical protein ACJX0J_031061, partial [Zea mays]
MTSGAQDNKALLLNTCSVVPVWALEDYFAFSEISDVALLVTETEDLSDIMQIVFLTLLLFVIIDQMGFTILEATKENTNHGAGMRRVYLDDLPKIVAQIKIVEYGSGETIVGSLELLQSNMHHENVHIFFMVYNYIYVWQVWFRANSNLNLRKHHSIICLSLLLSFEKYKTLAYVIIRLNTTIFFELSAIFEPCILLYFGAPYLPNQDKLDQNPKSNIAT